MKHLLRFKQVRRARREHEVCRVVRIRKNSYHRKFTNNDFFPVSLSLNAVNAQVIATSPEEDAMTNTSGDTPRSGSPSPSSSNNHSKEKNDTSDETKRTKSASESEVCVLRLFASLFGWLVGWFFDVRMMKNFFFDHMWYFGIFFKPRKENVVLPSATDPCKKSNLKLTAGKRRFLSKWMILVKKCRKGIQILYFWVL